MELDPDTHISENIRVDYLLDYAKITENQRLLIMTSENNRKDYSETEAALRRHHNKIHETESRRTQHADAPRRFGRPGRGGGGPGNTTGGRFGARRHNTASFGRAMSRNKSHRFKKRTGFYAAEQNQSDDDEDAEPDVLSQDTEEDAGSEPDEGESDDDAEEMERD